MRAFSLLEAIFSIFLLSFVFILFYQTYLNFVKNSSIISINQELFTLEKNLRQGLSRTKNIDVYVENIGLINLEIKENSSKNFKLYSINPKKINYEQHFKDEKSF